MILTAILPIDQIGQGILSLILIAGYVLQHKQASKVVTKADEIHILVNSQKADLERRIDDLEKALSLSKGEELKPGSTVTVKQEQPIDESDATP